MTNDTAGDPGPDATDEHGLSVESYRVRSDEPIDWAYEIEWLYDTRIATGVALYDVRMEMVKRLAELRMEQTKAQLETIQKEPRPRPAEPRRGGAFRSIEERVEELNLAALIAEPDEPIDWVWGEGDHGYIECASVGCLHAFGGVGKSMVMQALTRAVTSGDELLGMPCKQGRVLIIDAENPRREIKRRVKRLGLDPERTRYLRTNAPILKVGFSDWLYEEIIFHDADLLVLDSQRGLWGGDEKEANEVRLFYTELRNVAEETGCAIVVIHHDNKGLTFSGSTDIDAAVDFRLHMTRDPKETTIRYLEQAKMRGAEELPKIEVVIRFEGFRLFVEKGDRASAVRALTSNITTKRKASAEDIAMWIRQQPGQKAQPAEIRAQFGINSDSTVRSRRMELEAYGIHYIEDGISSVYYAKVRIQ